MSDHVFGQADDCIRCLDCEALVTTTEPCQVDRDEHTPTVFEAYTASVWGPDGWESFPSYRPARERATS